MDYVGEYMGIIKDSKYRKKERWITKISDPENPVTDEEKAIKYN